MNPPTCVVVSSLLRLFYISYDQEVADQIRQCVEDSGGFKDNASPELRKARAQKSSAEAKLKRALSSFSGQVTTNAVRRCRLTSG